MIATFLQDDLKAELESLFEDFRLDDPSGNRVAPNVYKQFLPIPTAQEIPDTVTDEELEEGTYDAVAEQVPFPYIIVRVGDGSIPAPGEQQKVNVTLLFGVIDRDSENQGHKDVLNMIQKISERFQKDPALAGKYFCLHPIEWALQEEESYPYFFGGMAMAFETAPIVREDPYA